MESTSRAQEGDNKSGKLSGAAARTGKKYKKKKRNTRK